MRKLSIAALALVLFCAGCTKEEAKQVSRETSAMAIKYNELCKAGKTTPEQDKKYIEAVASVAFELDRAIRGTSAAEVTKKAASIEAATGINVGQPLDLNKP